MPGGQLQTNRRAKMPGGKKGDKHLQGISARRLVRKKNTAGQKCPADASAWGVLAQEISCVCVCD